MIFFTSIWQKYMVRKNLQNYTSGAVGDGVRDLPSRGAVL
jgi:hypothetical protein